MELPPHSTSTGHPASAVDAAVLACMSYVNLYPVRAKMAETPEASNFTSIQQRTLELAPKQKEPQDEVPITPISLMKLVTKRQDTHPNSLGLTLSDYLGLVDWAGREICEGKRVAINEATPPILKRLNLDPHRLMEHLRGKAMLEKPVMLGSVDKMKRAIATVERKFTKGDDRSQAIIQATVYT